MGSLKRGRGLFEAEPGETGEHSTPRHEGDAVRSHDPALPWEPETVGVRRLGRMLAELDDSAVVRALAAADVRTSARRHYERRLAELDHAAPPPDAPPEFVSDSEDVNPAEAEQALDENDEDSGMLRITVYATLDQVEHLDDDRKRVRRAHRKILERTQIIRGLIEGYRRSGLDLVRAAVKSEEELAIVVAERLASGRIHEA